MVSLEMGLSVKIERIVKMREKKETKTPVAVEDEEVALASFVVVAQGVDLEMRWSSEVRWSRTSR